MTPSPRTAVTGETSPALVNLSAVRARVLCPGCIGQDDESFIYCQRCARRSRKTRRKVDEPPLVINKEAIPMRYAQLLTTANTRASSKSRSATAHLFSNFLLSRDMGGAQDIAAAQPKDAVFLCWLDSCGQRRRTTVHVETARQSARPICPRAPRRTASALSDTRTNLCGLTKCPNSRWYSSENLVLRWNGVSRLELETRFAANP